MKNTSFIEGCAIFCCSAILLCFVYLFWEQYSTTVKAGDVGVFIAALGAFAAAGIFYFQFKENKRQLSQQYDDNQRWLQDQLNESRTRYEETQRQFKESQEAIQERLKEAQKLTALNQEQFKDARESYKESQKQSQELFNESRKQFEELFEKSRDTHALSQKMHEDTRRIFASTLYQNAFFSLYDPAGISGELASDSKNAPVALLEMLELIRVNLLDQVIDESVAKRHLELALLDGFHGSPPAQAALLKYQLKSALLKYGLYLLEKGGDDFQERQKFLEIIFKMKKIRVAIDAENIKSKLNIMEIASQV